MTSNAIPFPHRNASAPLDEGPSDYDIAEMVNRAVTTIQEAMDRAMMAGLVVEPSFSLIENRLTPWGVRTEPYVCTVKSFRRLT